MGHIIFNLSCTSYCPVKCTQETIKPGISMIHVMWGSPLVVHKYRWESCTLPVETRAGRTWHERRVLLFSLQQPVRFTLLLPYNSAAPWKSPPGIFPRSYKTITRCRDDMPICIPNMFRLLDRQIPLCCQGLWHITLRRLTSSGLDPNVDWGFGYQTGDGMMGTVPKAHHHDWTKLVLNVEWFSASKLNI